MSYDSYVNLIEVLKAWRFHNQMTIRETARLLDISEGTLRRLEAGGEMSLSTFLAIGKWLLKIEKPL